jgi:hypothetical protein
VGVGDIILDFELFRDGLETIFEKVIAITPFLASRYVYWQRLYGKPHTSAPTKNTAAWIGCKRNVTG